MGSLFENIQNKNAVETLNALNKALKEKTLAAIGEARKQVAVDIFGDTEPHGDKQVNEAKTPRKDTRMNATIEDHGFKYTGKSGSFNKYEHPSGHTFEHKFPTPNGNHSFRHRNSAGKVLHASSNTGDTEINYLLNREFPKKKMTEALTDEQRKKLKDPICTNCGKVAGEHPNAKCKKHIKWDVSMVGKKPVKEAETPVKHQEHRKSEAKMPVSAKEKSQKRKDWDNDVRMPWPDDYRMGKGSRSAISGFSEHVKMTEAEKGEDCPKCGETIMRDGTCGCHPHWKDARAQAKSFKKSLDKVADKAMRRRRKKMNESTLDSYERKAPGLFVHPQGHKIEVDRTKGTITHTPKEGWGKPKTFGHSALTSLQTHVANFHGEEK